MSSKTPKRHLVSAAYAPSTLTRYNDAVSHFLSWCHTNDLDPSSPESFDDILTDYFHHLYDTNQGKGAAHNTLYGILMYLPHLKHHLHLASKSLVGWNKLYPPKSYPPLTWELCCLVAVRLAMDGHLLHAVATLLGFDCFLRIGELVGLRRDDVADVKDARMGGVSADMTLRLRSTKTGPNQWVVVENAAVKTLLRRTVAITKPGNFIFPFSASTFRNHFKAACASLGLSSSYVPHSLRHGGATRHHLLGRHMEDILLRGRWASSKSARRYIQAGRAMLMTMDTPPQVHALSLVVSADVLLFITLAQSHSVKVR